MLDPYSQTQTKQLTYSDRSVAWFIFGFLLACYLLTYTGVIQSSDGLSMFASVESIARRAEIDSNQLLWMGLQQGSFGPDGDLYGRKGLGMLLLALPLVWLAQAWDKIGMARAALLLTPLLTAWTGALLYRFCSRLSWNRAAAVFTALGFGLATLSWPYTQEFFSDPVCGWGLFAAFYGLYSYRQNGQKYYLLLSGLAWGLAYLARTINLLTLPIYGVALLFIVAEEVVRSERETRRQGDSGSRNSQFATHWRPFAAFFIPVILSGLLSLCWNWLRYGSLWETGYLESESFSADWLFGVVGLIFGPARGLIWYSPILLLVIGGMRWFWRNDRLALFVSLGLTFVYVALYGKWYMWHGGFSWGPRFLVPTLPFLALLTGPVWNRLVQTRNRIAWVGVSLLVAISIVVQWLGMLVPYGLVQNQLAETVTPLFAPETFIQLRYSPLLRQWDFLTRQNIALNWWRNGQIDWLALSMPLSGVVVGLFLIMQEMRHYWENRPSVGTRNWLYGGALTLIALAVLTYHPLTAQEEQIDRLMTQIETEEVAGDAILHLVPSESQIVSDQYSGRLPVFGLNAQNELDESNRQWLTRLRQQYKRIWVVSNLFPPEASGWELALRMDEFLLKEMRIAEDSQRRLALYAIAHPGELTESGSGIVFGNADPASGPVNADSGWIRLAGYALTSETQQNGAILIALRWESLRSVQYDYQVFVHLLNGAGEKLAQRDGQPVQWMRPTSSWRMGETIIDHYGLVLPAEALPGSYSVAVGLYDPVNGQRLRTSAGLDDYAIELEPVKVLKR